MPHLLEERLLQPANHGQRPRHPRGQVQGRNHQTDDGPLAVGGAQHGKVHPLPPLRNGLQPSPDRRRPVGRRPGIHFGPLHGLQRSDPDDQLRQLRPMRSRLSDQRPLGEQQHPGGDAGARRSRQDGRGADRPRRARGPRPGFRTGRPERHGQDDHSAASVGLRLRFRHRLRRRPDDHGGGHRTAPAPEQVSRGRPDGQNPPDDLLLSGLGVVHGEAFPRTGREPLDGQVAATDVRRDRQKLPGAQAGHRPPEFHRRIGHALRGEEIGSRTPRIRQRRRSGREHFDHHARTGPHDPLRQHELRRTGGERFRPSAGRIDRCRRHLRHHRRRDRGSRAYGIRNTNEKNASETRLHRTARTGGNPFGDDRLRRRTRQNRHRTRAG